MRDRPNAIMFFAAGFGTRMKHLTKEQPKPLVKVAGRALLDHALVLSDGLDLEKKVVNCHYFPDQIAKHLSDRQDITLIHEAGEILETGGGLKNALPELGNDPVFTSNTDAVWHGANPLEILLNAWEPAKMDALLLCVPKENAIGHDGSGNTLLLDHENRLSYGGNDIYTGVQIIKTNRLAEIDETSFSIKKLWEMFFEERRMFGVRYTGKWCDVGTPEGVALAENMLASADV